MPITAEDRTRESIDRLLSYFSWVIQSRDEANLSVGRPKPPTYSFCDQSTLVETRFNNLLEPDSVVPSFFRAGFWRL
jgi:hypothetical protein